MELGGPFGWFCEVRHKSTGKAWTYWVNQARMPREDLAAHIAQHFLNMEFVSCQPAIAPPDPNRKKHVPPDHFQSGAKQIIDAALMDRGESAMPPMRKLPFARIPTRRF